MEPVSAFVFPAAAEYAATFPMLMLAVASLVVVVIDAFWNDHKGVWWFTLATLGLAAVYTKWQLLGPSGLAWMGGDAGMANGTAFFGMIRTGTFADLVNLILLLAGFVTVLLAGPYLRRIGRNYGEVYALILVALVGAMALGNGASLVTMFVGLETMSVALYILTGLVRDDERSIESALKYFLLGAFASGFLLFGIALLYGATGTMDVAGLAGRISTLGDAVRGGAGAQGSVLYLGGLGLLLVGFLFKVSAAPFHMWAPDVYQGAPTPLSGFLATVGKTSAFAALILVVAQAGLGEAWRTPIAIAALLSMFIGNVAALAQDNVKRMLAYSSVAHAGYVLTGIASGLPEGYSGALYYLLVYTVMTLASFGVLAYLEWDGHSGAEQTVDSLAGMGQRHPLLGVVMSATMFSLLGFPPLAGFFGKLYVFGPAVKAGLTWLAIAGVLMSAISAYYYLRVVRVLWMKPAEEGAPALSIGPLPRAAQVALVACGVLLLLLSFVPGLTDGALALFREAPVAAASLPGLP